MVKGYRYRPSSQKSGNPTESCHGSRWTNLLRSSSSSSSSSSSTKCFSKGTKGTKDTKGTKGTTKCFSKGTKGTNAPLLLAPTVNS